jgi:hypothetical protein
MHPIFSRKPPQTKQVNHLAGAVYLGLLAATSLAIAVASGFVGTL